MFLQLVEIYPVSTLFEHRNKLNLPVSCAVRVSANELTVQGMHHNIVIPINMHILKYHTTL